MNCGSIGKGVKAENIESAEELLLAMMIQLYAVSDKDDRIITDEYINDNGNKIALPLKSS